MVQQRMYPKLSYKLTKKLDDNSTWPTVVSQWINVESTCMQKNYGILAEMGMFKRNKKNKLTPLK